MTTSYRDAGVDIEAGDAFVRSIAALVESTRRPGVSGTFGGFGGGFELDVSRYTRPVLVSGTDGVGTKLRIAFATGQHNTVGIDLVAMCVNDVVTSGAEPLFFLDYLGTGRLDSAVAHAVVRGVADGCREAGCALLGGETAEMPGSYPDGEYDLAGFCVGVVEAADRLDSRGAVPGDALVGIPSSGIHSNGYSLVRRVLLEEAGLGLDEIPPTLERSLGEELLEPTRIYVRPLLALLTEGVSIHGAAHVTGGGLVGNVPRMLEIGARARLHSERWSEPAIFTLIAEAGEVPRAEMERTFNLGLGMVIAVPASEAEATTAMLQGLGGAATGSCIIGEVIEGTRGCEIL